VPEPTFDLDEQYILYEYHPNSGLTTKREVIGATVASSKSQQHASPLNAPGIDALEPWRPYKSRADFEFAEIFVNAKMGQDTAKRYLAGVTGLFPDGMFKGLDIPNIKFPPNYVPPYQWFDASKITFKSRQDLDRTLERARKHILQVSCVLLLKCFILSRLYSGKQVTLRHH
jgi:hypothetical protein